MNNFEVELREYIFDYCESKANFLHGKSRN